jgi:hypothetical protein
LPDRTTTTSAAGNFSSCLILSSVMEGAITTVIFRAHILDIIVRIRWSPQAESLFISSSQEMMECGPWSSASSLEAP